MIDDVFMLNTCGDDTWPCVCGHTYLWHEDDDSCFDARYGRCNCTGYVRPRDDR